MDPALLLGASYQGSTGTEFSSQIHLCCRNAAPRLSLHMEQNSPVPQSAGVCCVRGDHEATQGFADLRVLSTKPRPLSPSGRALRGAQPHAEPATRHLGTQGTSSTCPAAYKSIQGAKRCQKHLHSSPLCSSLQLNTLPCSFPTCQLRILTLPNSPRCSRN